MKNSVKFVLASAACVCLCAPVFIGCGRPRSGGNGGNGGIGSKNEITLWVSDGLSFYRDAAEAFVSSKGNCKVNIELKNTFDAYSALASNPENCADVFMFSGEYAKELQKNNVLYKITEDYEKNVRLYSADYTVEPIAGGNGVYGFPATLDNGWFLWYNSDYYTSGDVTYLETVLQIAKNNGRRVRYMYDSFWYSAAFFNGAGCIMDYASDGVYQTDIDGEYGVKAMTAMYRCGLRYGDVICTDYDKETVDGLNNGTIIAAFGTVQMGAQLNANILPEKCPKFECGDYNYVSMKPYADGKYFGINSESKNKELAVELAEYLTGEQMQTARYEADKTIPANRHAIEQIETADNAVFVMNQQCKTNGAAHLYRHPETVYSDVPYYVSKCFNAFGSFDSMKYELTRLADGMRNAR